jgi:hypothetical protein
MNTSPCQSDFGYGGISQEPNVISGSVTFLFSSFCLGAQIYDTEAQGEPGFVSSPFFLAKNILIATFYPQLRCLTEFSTLEVSQETCLFLIKKTILLWEIHTYSKVELIT